MQKRKTLRKKAIRPVYREHTEEQTREAIRAAMPEGSILFDYFCQIKYDEIDDDTDWKRGVREGMRKLAGFLLDVAIEKPPVKIETEEDE